MTDKKLIPFNLERALAGDAVITRDGRIAKIVYVSEENKVNYLLCIVVIFKCGEDKEKCFWVRKSGRYLCDNSDHQYDLFMAPKTKTFWITVHKQFGGGIYINKIYPYDPRESQNSYSDDCNDYIKTVPIEIDESELL